MRWLGLALVALAACGAPALPAPTPAPTTAALVAPVAKETTMTSTANSKELRIVLRRTERIAAARAKAEVVEKPFSADAAWVVASGSADAERLDVSPSAFGMSSDAAWSAALANTKQALPADPFTVTNNVFIVFKDEAASATLLSPELLVETVKHHLAGRAGKLLAVCPEENIIIYTFGGPSDVALLRAAAREGKTSARPLSELVMEWDGQTWKEAK